MICFHHIIWQYVLKLCNYHQNTTVYTIKQQHNNEQFPHPSIRDRDGIFLYCIVKSHGKKNILCESTAVMLCQTLRCKKNKPVNQLWQQQWQLCFIVSQTEEISFNRNCIYLNVNTTWLVLVYYSLSDDLSPRMNHLWGDLFSKRNKIINSYGTGCKNTI